MSEGHFKSHIGDSNLRRSISNLNLTKWLIQQKIVKKHEFVLFNLQYLLGLSKSKVYSNEISWMNGMKLGDIYSTVYKHLFLPAPNIQKQVKDFLYKNVPDPKQRLVCMHVRMGHDSNIGDGLRRFGAENLPLAFKSLRTLIRSSDKVFLMSDSDKVVQAAKKEPFG